MSRSFVVKAAGASAFIAMTTAVALASSPYVTSFTIDVQNGQTQRSYVRYLTMTFDASGSLINLLNDGRIQLTAYDLNGNNGNSMLLLSGAVVNNTITVDFGVQGIGGNANTNVGDGYYEVSVDMDGNGSFDSSKYFYRLLGDVSGDTKVTSADKVQVLLAAGTTNPESDANGNGIVNILDTSLVSRAMNRMLKSGLPLND